MLHCGGGGGEEAGVSSVHMHTHVPIGGVTVFASPGLITDRKVTERSFMFFRRKVKRWERLQAQAHCIRGEPRKTTI